MLTHFHRSIDHNILNQVKSNLIHSFNKTTFDNSHKEGSNIFLDFTHRFDRNSERFQIHHLDRNSFIFEFLEYSQLFGTYETR